MKAVANLGSETELSKEDSKSNSRIAEVKVERSVFERKRIWKVRIEGDDELVINTSEIDLKPNDILMTDKGLKVVVRSKEEPLVTFDLRDPVEAFALGFNLGNMHAQTMLEEQSKRIATPALLGWEFYKQRFSKYKPQLKSGVFIQNVQAMAGDLESPA